MKQPFSFLEAIKRFLASFSPRTADIVSSRFGLDGGKMKTLEEIGKSYGITRERVRQILQSAFSSVKQKREDPTFVEVAGHIESFMNDRSGVVNADELLSALSDGDRKERGAISFFLECLRTVKEEKETGKRGRVFAVSDFPFDELDDMLGKAEDALRGSGSVLDEDRLYQAVKKGGLSLDKKTFFDYLAVSSAIKRNAFGRWGFADSSEIRPRGTREKAYLVLKMEGAPLHFKEIAKRIDESGLQKKGRTTHPQTVHNELIKDRKFVLVGRGLYALAEWGYSRGTVREVIGEILRNAKAPMKRDEILDAVFKVRQVKRSTVVINLNAFFEKVGKDAYTVK